jgi:multicomponent Na+:H+ antiporter subunit E
VPAAIVRAAVAFGPGRSRTLVGTIGSGLTGIALDNGRAMFDSFGRLAGFLAFWLVIAGPNPVDLVVGVAAAMAATWASRRLLPPGEWRFRPVALAGFTLRFLRQSIGAGLDVAWRALDPRLPLRPGFVVYRPGLPPCPTRSAFCTISSLMPGTLPCGTAAGGGVTIHCLDVGQPVAQQMAAEEAAFVRALGG